VTARVRVTVRVRITARVRTTTTMRMKAKAIVRATARCQCLENRVSKCSKYTYRTQYSLLDFTGYNILLFEFAWYCILLPYK